MLEMAKVYWQDNAYDACEQQCYSILRLNTRNFDALILLVDILCHKLEYSRSIDYLATLLKVWNQADFNRRHFSIGTIGCTKQLQGSFSDHQHTLLRWESEEIEVLH